ncbi:uncharacterized protein METZ01_LOCUS347393, partial [marine metagenome]
VRGRYRCRECSIALVDVKAEAVRPKA